MNDRLFVSIIVFVLVGHIVAGIYFMFHVLMKKNSEEPNELDV